MSDTRETRICPCCGWRHRSEDCLRQAVLEAWEEERAARVELLESGDTAGLVDYLEDVVARRGGDVYALKNLGEAYVAHGEPEKAIGLLAPVHRREPDFEDVQIVLLDALFALGRDESDFEWERQIPVIRLGPETLANCRAYLALSAEPREVGDLYCDLLASGYCTFAEQELLQALRDDRRFVVEEGVSPKVMIWRKRASGGVSHRPL